MTNEFGYRFCSRCGKGLVRDQEGPVCLPCGWRPPVAGDAKGALESMTIDDYVNIWRESQNKINARIRVHESEIEQLRSERAKYDRMIAAATGDTGRRKAAARGGTSAVVPDGERWTCKGCGWQSTGRSPGRHTQFCAAYLASAAS